MPDGPDELAELERRRAELYRELGLKLTTVKRGKSADLFSTARALTDEERRGTPRSPFLYVNMNVYLRPHAFVDRFDARRQSLHLLNDL